MTTIYDRSSGRKLADLEPGDFEFLRQALEAYDPEDEGFPVDADLIERYAEIGLSHEAAVLLRQALAGRESMDLGLHRD